VGGNDLATLRMNLRAQTAMAAVCRLRVVPAATHLFDEPGALERVAELARDWFIERLNPADTEI
jgi:hypothetical protein